jgi:hypothetical protein
MLLIWASVRECHPTLGGLRLRPDVGGGVMGRRGRPDILGPAILLDVAARSVAFVVFGLALLIGGTAGAAGSARERATSCSSPRDIALGSRRPNGPYAGWGACRPRWFSNGGDPSGTVTEIYWTSWGGRVATGRGRASVFRPGGGYYGRKVVIYLRPYDVGRCSARGRRAYLRLRYKHPDKPGGTLGPWREWEPGRTLCNSY